MQPTDAKRFNEILTGMCVTFGREPDAVLLDAYWLALSDWSLADFEQAALHLLRNAKHMPRPAEFNELRKASRETAGEAWTRAVAHARELPTHGGYLQEIPSGDAHLDAIARTVGGYKAIANASDRDLQFIEKRFAENFEAVGDAQDTRRALPNLTSPRIGGTQSVTTLLARAQ